MALERADKNLSDGIPPIHENDFLIKKKHDEKKVEKKNIKFSQKLSFKPFDCEKTNLCRITATNGGDRTDLLVSFGDSIFLLSLRQQKL